MNTALSLATTTFTDGGRLSWICGTMARTAAGVFKQQLLHHGYPGRVATAGNLAFAFTPSELDAHDAYRFVLYHVMERAPMGAIFRIACHDLPGPGTA